MSRAQCPGCMKLASCREVRYHILTCGEYLDLFKSEPDECIDPERYLRERQAENKDEDVKEERRAKRYEKHLQQVAAEISFDKERWATPPDPLSI